MKTQMFILIVVVFIMVGNVQADLIWDSGDHIFSEGYESEIFMYNDATADITGGGIGMLWCQDNTSVDVFEGSAISLLRPNDFNTTYIYGGNIQTIFALGYSQAEIYGGGIDEIDAVDSSIVRLFVNPGYTFDPTGGTFGDGLITGTWLVGNAEFSINLVGDECIEHLVFIPEPTTLVLSFCGMLCLLVRKKKC